MSVNIMYHRQNNTNEDETEKTTENKYSDKRQLDQIKLKCSGHHNVCNAAYSLKRRLSSLHELVKRRESLIHVAQGIQDPGMNPNDIDVKYKELNDEKKNKFASHDSVIVQTNESNRQSFQSLIDECDRKRKCFENSQNRVTIPQLERKKNIKGIEKLLEHQTCKLLLTYTGSLEVNHDEGATSDNKMSQVSTVTLPIPFNEFKIIADLLMKLSCEKMSIDHGRGLMKLLSTSIVSLELFINTYWFMHCRFHQQNSNQQQNLLLKQVSHVFPRFLKLLISTVASTQQRDTLFRNYLFVLSKAIYLGLQYMYPQNQSLSKGPFLRVLYITIFRLMSGVNNICPNSINIMLIKIYPEDIEKNESKNDKIMKCTLECNQKRDGIKHNSSHKSLTNLSEDVRMLHCYDERNKKLSMKESEPRFLDLNFDVNQISPLLQQFLGRECISLRPKQYIKLTEPTKNNKDINMNGSSSHSMVKNNDDIIDEDDFIQHHSELKEELKASLLQNEKEYQNVFASIRRKYSKALRHDEIKQNIISTLVTSGHLCIRQKQ